MEIMSSAVVTDYAHGVGQPTNAGWPTPTAMETQVLVIESCRYLSLWPTTRESLQPTASMHAHTRTHIHAHMHIHTHSCTHTHTHTHRVTHSLSLCLSLSPTHTPSLFSCHSICLIISFFLSGVTFIQPFLLLLCVFQMHSGDWSRCDAKYKVYECMFKVLKVSSWHEHACLIWYPMFRELLLDLFNFKSFP